MSEKDENLEVELEEENNDDLEAEEEDSEESEDTEEEDSDESEDDSEDELERLKRENGSLKRSLKKAQKIKSKPAKKQANETEDDRIERLELRVEGYSEDVIDEIMSFGGRSALKKSKVLQRAVNDLVKQEKAERASNVKSGSKSDISRKYTEAELRNMPSAKLKEILSKQ